MKKPWDFKLKSYGETKKTQVQSVLPLINLNYDFNEKEIFSLEDITNTFVYDSKTWVGSINFESSRELNDKIKLYCSYFSNNLAHRTCQKNKNVKVAAFIDNDWLKYYQDYKDLSETTIDFKKLIDFFRYSSKNPQDFTKIAIHSESHTHHEEDDNQNFSTTLTTGDVLVEHPKSKFYNLYACSAGLRTYDYPNLAQTYLELPITQGVLSSTITGSLIADNLFYRYLRFGYSFGTAYLNVMKRSLPSSDHGFSMQIGLVYYGDPTLKLHGCDEKEKSN